MTQHGPTRSSHQALVEQGFSRFLRCFETHVRFWGLIATGVARSRGPGPAGRRGRTPQGGRVPLGRAGIPVPSEIVRAGSASRRGSMSSLAALAPLLASAGWRLPVLLSPVLDEGRPRQDRPLSKRGREVDRV